MVKYFTNGIDSIDSNQSEEMLVVKTELKELVQPGKMSPSF